MFSRTLLNKLSRDWHAMDYTGIKIFVVNI